VAERSLAGKWHRISASYTKIKRYSWDSKMNQFQIFMPPPKDWQDFQILTAEVARVKYVSDSVQEYGRQGQSQNGVDVFARDIFDKNIGIQCKETKKNGLTTAIVDNEAKEAGKFSPQLDLFIVATTQRTDVNIQKHINQINSTKTHKFKVQIWFWDDINLYINMSQAVMSSCYKAFLEQFGAEEIQNHLAGVKVAFDRSAFTDDFLYERNYNDFEDALASTKAMLKTGFLYDRWTRSLVAQVVPSSMIGDGTYQIFIHDVEKLLEKIYQDFIRDKKLAQGNPRHLEDRAEHYNISRRKLVDLINRHLQDANIDRIQVSY
jgi:hypothetical protein